ncbi:MAG TPA: glutaminyl-peptide cyclotransferase, partial [Candidatus Atribacteria bacterium]|nr:glutaminyl-peptide cyclotransferase [Candidatus Atribacteria bacterium]
IQVHLNGLMINQLNELEFINGKIYSNVWHTDLILIINPDDGEVIGYLFGAIIPPIIQASMGITLYALFIALLIPEVKKFYPAAIIAGIGGLTHSFLTWLKVFSPGWNIIIAIFSAAILGALLMGKDEEEVQ